MPYKVFVAGEEALAADANQYLMSQTVPRFTNATQRTSQLTAPVLNQLSMLDSRPGVVQYWSGGAWVDLTNSTQAFGASPTPSAAGDAVIAFPVAFATAPVVVCTSSSVAFPNLVVTAITASNVTVRVVGNTGTALGIQVVAVGAKL